MAPASIHIVFHLRARAALCLLGLAWGCGRSGLGIEDGAEFEDGAPPVADASTMDAAPIDAGISTCVPSEEICNGVDDDCDGTVDEVPAVPCPEGGSSYCVAGKMSECPRRCDVCIPGSERICFISYCKYWAVQTCAADGKSFGKCEEQDPPAECKAVAKDKKYSKALEECCLAAGYCCLDAFDLDDDGNTQEMIGQCEDVLCSS
ncbi:MAG: hypothetical protein R3B13_05855 [Polyangiaceae bacterium]